MMEGVGGDRPSWREWEETDDDGGSGRRKTMMKGVKRTEMVDKRRRQRDGNSFEYTRCTTGNAIIFKISANAKICSE